MQKLNQFLFSNKIKLPHLEKIKKEVLLVDASYESSLNAQLSEQLCSHFARL